MTPNPVAPTTPPAAAPAVSPTGTPLLSPKLTPYLFALFTLATTLAGAGQIPGVNIPANVTGIAGLVALLLAGVLGITPGLRKAAPLVLLCLAVGFSSCSSAAPAIVVTGQSIVATGKTFEATAAVFNSLHASHAITEAQYGSWYKFGLRFKASFEAARKLYDAAAEGGDVSSQQVAASIISDFIAELGTFEALIEQVARPDGGAA